MDIDNYDVSKLLIQWMNEIDQVPESHTRTSTLSTNLKAEKFVSGGSINKVTAPSMTSLDQLFV